MVIFILVGVGGEGKITYLFIHSLIYLSIKHLCASGEGDTANDPCGFSSPARK